MPNNIGSFLSNAGQAAGLGAILVGLGIYVGTAVRRITVLEEHPSKAAHIKQLQETVRTKLLLEQILARGRRLEKSTAMLPQLVEKVDRLEHTVVKLKAEILTEVALKFADQRWRRDDMYDLCRRTEERNPGWKCVFPDGGKGP